MEKRKKFLIEKFRELIEKNHWHGNEDIYEYDEKSDLLEVYGHNGRFYIFAYDSDDDWQIDMHPNDPINRRFWHGVGKEWEVIDGKR